MNKYPDYWVLRNTNKEGRKVTWCVPLKGNNIYCRRIKDEDENLPKAMKEVHKALESGQYRLVKKDNYKSKRSRNRDDRDSEDDRPKEQILVQLSDTESSSDY